MTTEDLGEKISSYVADLLIDKWKIIQQRLAQTKQYKITTDYHYQMGQFKMAQDILHYLIAEREKERYGEERTQVQEEV